MSDDLIKRSDAIDTIYREDAIKAINLRARIPHDVASAHYASMAINAIRSVPSADRPQGWIPCSERLPREEEQDDELGVLVTLGNGYSGIQYDWYHGDHWYDWDGYVLAWMPLPKPWKGADDERP